MQGASSVTEPKCHHVSQSANQIRNVDIFSQGIIIWKKF